GRIADRIGRKLPLQVGLLWDAVSLFLYSIASTPLLLALVRISHGIGSGFVGPSSMALIADTSTPERKGRSMALYGISLALAVVIGFGIAGPVVARLGYSTLFYILSGDPGADWPCGGRHRDGQYSARPRPVDAPRPDGPFRCRSRFRVPRGVDARFSRRRPGSARRRDGLVLRRPRFRGRGRCTSDGRRGECHDLRRRNLGECLGLAHRPGVSCPCSHFDRDALGRRLDEIDEWSQVGREPALLQTIARENHGTDHTHPA